MLRSENGACCLQVNRLDSGCWNGKRRRVGVIETICLMTKMKMKSKRAFTLIEMLVVIAIVAILAALLLPALSRGKDSAKSAACKSNLRQLGLAMTMYANEFRYYPPQAHRDTSINQFVTYAWPAKLLPHVSDSKGVFRCPSRGAEFNWPTNRSQLGYDFPLNIDIGTTPFSYGYNAWSADGGVGGLGLSDTLVTRVLKPADMIAIADSDGHGDIHFFRYRGVPVDPPGDLHSRGANVVFCDGHIEWQKQVKWVELTEAAARRWHNDNQPHREAWFVGTPPKN